MRCTSRDTGAVARLRAADYPFFDHPGPLPMAHRGGARYPPNVGLENSRAAFANAVAVGYRYLETDVHASRDGKVFAFHDATLDRMTGSAGQIRMLDAAVVRRARIGGREPVPYLAELFEEFPHARFNVDVKDENAIEPLARLLDHTANHDRVCVASFSTARLRQVRALLGPRVATSLGASEVAALRLSSAAGRRRTSGARHTAVAAQVPHKRGPVTVVTDRFLDAAHRAGLAVHVWTIDDAGEIRQLLDRGVDGIITDRPDVLRDVLIARGQWHQSGA